MQETAVIGVVAIWLLFLWIAPIILCMVVASKKERSLVGAFFLGFFLGWIGLIIVACMANYRKLQQMAQPTVVVNTGDGTVSVDTPEARIARVQGRMPGEKAVEKGKGTVPVAPETDSPVYEDTPEGRLAKAQGKSSRQTELEEELREKEAELAALRKKAAQARIDRALGK